MREGLLKGRNLGFDRGAIGKVVFKEKGKFKTEMFE